MESELAFVDDNFWKFHVLCACTSDACALETRGRFVTEQGKKKESRKLNPGFTAWVIKVMMNRFLARLLLHCQTVSKT